MTIEEIKEKYGDGNGYVRCDKCPVSGFKGECYNCLQYQKSGCSGYEDAWQTIKEYLDSPEHNTYVQNVISLLDRQTAKGLEKYGEALEDNTTLCIAQRIEHLQEELIDGLMYCEHIKAVNDHLTANDYQRMAMRTAGEYKTDYDMMRNAAYGLNGEAGEVIDIMKKHEFQGHELDREALIDELGDVQWYVALMATALGVTLEDVMEHNVNKLVKRYPDGFDKARSINRDC